MHLVLGQVAFGQAIVSSTLANMSVDATLGIEMPPVLNTTAGGLEPRYVVDSQ